MCVCAFFLGGGVLFLGFFFSGLCFGVVYVFLLVFGVVWCLLVSFRSSFRAIELQRAGPVKKLK